ncbi:hypothetical protein [Ideonella sp. YS5]|uniref:hypothetical protein n=1 Tax=Ideonella sp. YS5 TaxID=3453714 RepID=UPI003EE8513B
MSQTLSRTLTLLATLSALSVFAVDASAALRVTCEVRSDRSRASVDGSNLASGNYSAVLVSGANSAQSLPKHTVGDEVEFDFDSNRRDVRQGATEIAKNFIVNGQATGKLLNANGNVVASKTVNCRQR